MAEEGKLSTEELNLELDEADIAELVQGIDQERIIGLVKHTKYLRQHVFPGFRPDHLPWSQVPDKLAHDANGDPHKVELILKFWRECNTELLADVANLSTDDLRKGVIELLIRRGVESRERIRWALRLDNRPEVQQALKEGLDQELSGEASVLINQTQCTLLAQTLEEAQTQLTESEKERKAAQAELEDLRRLLQRKTEQVEKWRTSYETVAAEQGELRARLSELEAQHQTDQRTVANLQHQLQDEQTAAQELRRSVADLKATLRAQTEERGAGEALLQLEDERKASASLRLKTEKLTQQLGDAYRKRDETLAEVEAVKKQLERAQYDKSAVIEEKRRLQIQLGGMQAELKELRTVRDEQTYQRVLEAIPIANLESAWLDARTAIRRHIHGVLTVLKANGETQVELDKGALWQEWAEQENSLVKVVLAALGSYRETGILPDQAGLKEAQRLLALRWYLLEYTSQVIQYAELQSFPL
jgi:hypothetical protein